MSKNPKPGHIAIILDGNGRWAQDRNLPRAAGHKAGVDRVRDIVNAAADQGVKVLTLYAFSQENWKRPADEVGELMRLLDYFLDAETRTMAERGVCLRVLGHPEALPKSTYEKIKKAVDLMKNNKALYLNIALNYGSRAEILDAVRKVVSEVRKDPSIADRPDFLTEESFSAYLDTRGLPDPDLLIRTSGEMRLSNFLLWQLSYSEIYITKKYWPDFTRDEFAKAIEDYQSRERRFGDVLV